MVAVFATAQPAWAQASAEVAAEVDTPSVGDLGNFRLRYGAAFRSGGYNDSGPGLTYSGTTEDDVELSARFFGHGYLGGVLCVQREGFSLNAGGVKVTSGSLLRAEVGPAGRIALGPLQVELMVGYGFAQLPLFPPSALPVFAAATRHSLMLASRLHLDLPFGAMAEAHGEFPIPLSVKDSGGGNASSFGFSAGASLGLRVARSDRVAYGVALDYAFVRDTLTAADGSTASQRLNRVGLLFDVAWVDAPAASPAPKFGGLLVTVLSDTGAPLANATVTFRAGTEQYPVVTGPDGKAVKHELAPGPVVASVTAGGFLPAEAQGTVTAGQDTAVELRIKKEPPKKGAVAVTFVDKENKAPLPKVVAKVGGGAELTADEGGKISVTDLPPGPVEIIATLPGYRPAQEVASVIAGQTSPVEVQMVKAQQKVLANIKGVIRSTDGGKPIAATLQIPEAQVKTRADARGEFSVKVVGGTYRVNISAPGYLTQNKVVTVKDGDETIFDVDLHPLR